MDGVSTGIFAMHFRLQNYRNTTNCRELPTMSDTNNENVGTVKANSHNGFDDCFRHFRQENDGVGLEQ